VNVNTEETKIFFSLLGEHQEKNARHASVPVMKRIRDHARRIKIYHTSHRHCAATLALSASARQADGALHPAMRSIRARWLDKPHHLLAG
jgi:hypothetical protein